MTSASIPTDVPGLPADLQVDPAAFKLGEPITLIDSKGRRNLVFLAEGKRLHLPAGYVDPESLIGALPGARIRTNKGQVVAAYRTTLDEYVLLMPRAATVIPPKDIPFIIQFADIAPGNTVVEAGVGSGGLTLGLLRAVGGTGQVISFELREDHANRARKNIDAWPDGLGHRADIRIGDVHQELAALSDIDRLVLDLPDPHNVLDAAAKALKPGGFVVVYTPGIRQIDTFVTAVLDHRSFAEAEVAEVILRPWVADRIRLRPELRITGHTGFIARARRRGAPAAPHELQAPEVDQSAPEAETDDQA